MAVTSKKVTAGDEIKATDHNALVDDVTALDGKKTAWNDVTGKPSTFPAKIGTAETDAKAGNYVPKWGDVTEKPSTFAPATHTHSYNDLENKPTIPTVPGKMSAAEATAGTATTARTIDAKTLNDLIDEKIAAANAGGGE